MAERKREQKKALNERTNKKITNMLNRSCTRSHFSPVQIDSNQNDAPKLILCLEKEATAFSSHKSAEHSVSVLLMLLLLLFLKNIKLKAQHNKRIKCKIIIKIKKRKKKHIWSNRKLATNKWICLKSNMNEVHACAHVHSSF